MSAYVIVEFTVKDPDVYREKYSAIAGGQPRSTEARFSPQVSGRSCMAIPCSPQGRSCGFRTMSRQSAGTTRLNISS